MKRVVLVISALVSIALITGIAEAKPNSYASSTTLEVKATTLAGKISSSKAACRKNRTVHGIFLAPGAHLITEPATSDSSGRWTIDFEVSPGTKGRLTITVAPSNVGGATCKGTATSEVVAR